MRKIRLGLVGCGKMMKTHAKAVDECTQEMSITAVCDIIPERAKEVADALDHPMIFSGLQGNGGACGRRAGCPAP